MTAVIVWLTVITVWLLRPFIEVAFRAASDWRSARRAARAADAEFDADLARRHAEHQATALPPASAPPRPPDIVDQVQTWLAACGEPQLTPRQTVLLALVLHAPDRLLIAPSRYERQFVMSLPADVALSVMVPADIARLVSL